MFLHCKTINCWRRFIWRNWKIKTLQSLHTAVLEITKLIICQIVISWYLKNRKYNSRPNMLVLQCVSFVHIRLTGQWGNVINDVTRPTWVRTRGGGGGGEGEGTPISDLYGYVRPQTPHYLPWPVRWTPIFLSLSVRSPHKIYRDSFVHRELWNYLSLVGNWLFRTLVFGLKMSQIAPQSI